MGDGRVMGGRSGVRAGGGGGAVVFRSSRAVKRWR